MNGHHATPPTAVVGSRLGYACLMLWLFLFPTLLSAGLGQEPQSPPVRDRTSEFLQKMNDRQRIHARVFQDPDYTTRLLDTLQSIDDNSMYFLNPKEVDHKEQLRQLFCSSDAVFAGIVKTSESFPTETGTFLFTEYSVLLTDVFRSPLIQGLKPDQAVVFVRLGGSIYIERLTVRATTNYYPPLQIGSRCLIFAREITQTGSYTAPNPQAVFVLDDTADTSHVYSGDFRRLPSKTTFGLLHTEICK